MGRLGGRRVKRLFLLPETTEEGFREIALRSAVGEASALRLWFEAKYDSKGDRIFGGDANGTLSFQLAQLRIGPDKVPVSIVLYIDKTFMRRGIPIRPVYCKLSYTISHKISNTISHTIFISQMFTLFFSAFWHLPLVAVGSQNNDIHVMSKSYAWAPGGAQAAPWAPGGILSSRRDPIKIGLFNVHDILLLIRWLFVGSHHFNMQVRNRMRVNMMSQNQFHLVLWAWGS